MVLKAISRAIDQFCAKHRNLGIANLMKYIAVCTGVVFLINALSGIFFYYLLFIPERILAGEIWRLVTWIFLPIDFSPMNTVIVAIVLYFYYSISSDLELAWGKTKFNLFYFSGVILNIIYGLLAWYVVKTPVFLDPVYLNFSVLMAFAIYYPDSVIRLFMIIPIKVKWLAVIEAAYFIYSGAVAYINEGWGAALVPLIAILNFLLICGGQISKYSRHVHPPKTKNMIDFKKAAKKAKQDFDNAPYKSKCSVCGKTDLDSPDLEFRYCSRCDGYHCFCTDHINNHVHFK